MPFGRTVSIGRGSFTFRMSFETGARFSRSTLLVGIDLSWAPSPWLQPVAANATARSTAAAARVENLKLMLSLIEIPLRPYRAISSSPSTGELLFEINEPGQPVLVLWDWSRPRFAR